MVNTIVQTSTTRPPQRPRSIQKRPIWMERPNPIVQLVKSIALGISVILVLLPFWAVIATSLADDATIARSGGMVLWPDSFSLNAYRAILSGGVVTRALMVSVGITVVGTLVSLAASAGMAYWLSRPRSPFARVGLVLVLGAILFSPGLIPSYLIVKQVGLLDNYWALILPGLVSAFNVLVLRAFFQGIPASLYEAAALDGARPLTTLVRIVLPLSKAVLAVLGLFYAVGYWNAFFNALLYMETNSKWPMALVLRTFVVNQTPVAGDQVGYLDELPPQLSLQMAILMVAIIPILIVYPFLQRHFAKGVLIGAVKG